MTRTVARRPKYKTQPTKNPDARTGLCGWCIGWGRVPHHECAGMKRSNLICTCVTCYGPPTTTTKKEQSSAN